MFAMGGFAIFSTQYLQSVLGFSPLVGALWSLLPTVVVGAAAPVASQLAQRGVPRNRLMAAGFGVSAVGFAVLSQLGTDGLVPLMVGAGLEAAGLVVVMSLGTELVMGAVPPERAGAASAVSETGSEFGGALGIAILGSIGTTVYRSTIAVPAGTPAPVRTAARQTLEGAVQVAGQLPGRAGDALTHAARVAFTGGLHAAALTGIGVMLAGAVLALTTLRGAQPTIPAQRDPETHETTSEPVGTA